MITFRFIKDVNLRKKWMKACGLRKLKDLSYLCICSQYFSNADIIIDNQGPSINPGSIPSINKHSEYKIVNRG